VAKPKPDDPKQAAAFRKAARELGADESDERFKEALRTLGKRKSATPKANAEIGKSVASKK
jgi:hypothetical protein